ncbi:hypothetical protein [Burkholderia cepacia]|uniref:hypothetical protein n=1 Tax=Burkholderia cepacia TaxID=292 RepID=UPI00075A6CDB|nr:hypothetical protein [Burkholderia cepacia]KWF99077.1 hypothetical protein WL95_00235 [Burkholderia cepacia]
MTAATRKAAATKAPAAKKTAPKAATRKPAAKSRESKTSARKVKAADRGVQAMQLRKLGYSFEEIGGVLGISRQAAHQLVKKYLADAVAQATEEAEELRQLQLARLDHLFCKALPQAEAGDTKALNACRQIVMDQAKLQGIVTDKSEVEANVTTGVFAVPMAAMSKEEWAELAKKSTAGEEDEAEKLIEDADAPAAS